MTDNKGNIAAERDGRAAFPSFFSESLHLSLSIELSIIYLSIY